MNETKEIPWFALIDDDGTLRPHGIVQWDVVARDGQPHLVGLIEHLRTVKRADLVPGFKGYFMKTSKTGGHLAVPLNDYLVAQRKVGNGPF